MEVAVVSNSDAVLAPMALERARLIAPVVAVVMFGALLISESSGLPVVLPVLAWNLFAIGATLGLYVALRRQRIAARWGHTALALVWWGAMVGTLISQHVSPVPMLGLLLVVKVISGCIMLNSAWLIGSFAVLNLVWVPLALREVHPQTQFFLVLLFFAQLFAVLFQRLHRNWLVQAETHRKIQQDTAQELALQLAELQRSEEERARLHEQLLHAQRLEATGTLAAGLAHDMNNILASITSFAELLHDQVPTSSGREDLGRIVAQAERGAALTRSLLAFSRRGQYRKQVIALDAVLRDVVPMLARTLPKAIEVRTELGAGTACIEVDPAQLGQAIVNLGVNASDAMDGKGLLAITTERLELDAPTAAGLGLAPGPHVRLRITDTGAGMDEPTRRRVFEPFFTTKPLGKGTGLGLSTVWGVVQSHAGAVRVDSRVGAGTTFLLYLPITSALPVDEPAPPPVVERPRRATVLVVDDEPAVRAGTVRLLARRGFDVLEASNGEEALAVFAANQTAIGLVILDMGMPVMGGPECFARLREHSTVPVLLATGYAVDAEAQALLAQGAALLEKPFLSSELIREVTRLLDSA